MSFTNVVYLVIRKDSLDRSLVLSGFVAERDAESYMDNCKKRDDNYGLATMKYEYAIQQILIQNKLVGVG